MYFLSHFLSLPLFLFVLSVFPEDLEFYYLNLKKKKEEEEKITAGMGYY